MKKFGLALGGGGVKGLAHIALLKKLDELGIKPTCIAGSSMGAILGALYAAGLSGLEIEARVRDHIVTRKQGFRHAYSKRQQLVKWVKVFAFEKSRGGILTADGLFQHLFTELLELNFEDLNVPFTAISCDFHNGQEVALTSGPVLDAVRASMAVPGVFAPVSLNNRLLIDGGVINNVPANHVTFEDGLVIASDVICLSENSEPTSTQVLTGTMSIMLRAATENQFRENPPDFLFQPDTREVDAFDFHKINKVLDQGELAMQYATPKLEQLFAQKKLLDNKTKID